MTNSFKVENLPDKKKDSRKKVVAIVVLLLLLFALLIWLIIHFCFPAHAPDPAKLTNEEAVKFVASKKFYDLPVAEKESYLDKMRSKSGSNPRQLFSVKLSDQERRTMMQNMRPIMEKKRKEEMKKFFALSKAEQIAELDRRIAEMEARRKSGQMGPPGGGGGGGGRGGPPGGPSGMFENSSAASRAQMSEMGRMMRARMEAKGIKGPP